MKINDWKTRHLKKTHLKENNFFTYVPRSQEIQLRNVRVIFQLET